MVIYSIVLTFVGVFPPPNNPRALEALTAFFATSLYLCSVVPDGGTKYPCVSNVVTPLNSVPYVKFLVSPGFVDAIDTLPFAARICTDPMPALDDAVTESELLQQSNTVSLIASNSCVGGVKFDL